MNPANKHEFAIYIPLADHHQVNTILIMHDKLVYHRIINVLRYAINDILIIFNQRQILTCKIIDIDKKKHHLYRNSCKHKYGAQTKNYSTYRSLKKRGI